MRTILERLGPGGPFDLSQVVEQFREKFFTTLKPGDLEAALARASVGDLEPDGTFVATLPLRSWPGEALCIGDEPIWLVP